MFGLVDYIVGPTTKSSSLSSSSSSSLIQSTVIPSTSSSSLESTLKVQLIDPIYLSFIANYPDIWEIILTKPCLILSPNSLSLDHVINAHSHHHFHNYIAAAFTRYNHMNTSSNISNSNVNGNLSCNSRRHVLSHVLIKVDDHTTNTSFANANMFTNDGDSSDSHSKAININAIMGSYKTLANELVYVEGNEIICGNGFSETRRVRITNIEQLNIEGLRSSSSSVSHCVIPVVTINRPLRGGVLSPEEADHMTIDILMKYIQYIRSFPALDSIWKAFESTIREINVANTETINSFDLMQPSLQVCLMNHWLHYVDALHHNRTVEMNQVFSNDDLSIRFFFEQIVESFFLYSLSDSINPWFQLHCDEKSVAVNAALRDLKSYTMVDFDIAPEFQCYYFEAQSELCRMSMAKTPAEKMMVMQSVVSSIRTTVDHHLSRTFPGTELEMATDDLVMILIHIIAQSYPDYRTLAVDVLFAVDFHFASSAKTQLGYSLCHFQVCLTWIINYCLRHKLVDSVDVFEDKIESETSELSPIRQSTPLANEELQRKSICDIAQWENELFALTNLPTEDDSYLSHVSPASPDCYHALIQYSVCHDESEIDLRLNESVVSETSSDNLLAPAQGATTADNSCVDSDTKCIAMTGEPPLKANVELFSTSVLSPIKSSPPTRKTTTPYSTIVVVGGQHPQPAMDYLSTKWTQKITLNSDRTNKPGRIQCVVGYDRYFGAISEDGCAYTWGLPESGRLGHSFLDDTEHPFVITKPRAVYGFGQGVRISQLACGKKHMLAISAGGTLFAWGDNSFGQLGIPNKPFTSSKPVGKKSSSAPLKHSTGDFLWLPHSSYPVLVESLRSTSMKSIAAGAFHSLGLSIEDNKIYSWGRAANGRLGTKAGYVSTNPTCSSGIVDFSGVCLPNPIICDWGASTIANTKVIQIVAGHSHNVVVTSTGICYTWGKGTYGRLGHGSHCDQYTPLPVRALFGRALAIISAAAGVAHTIFLTQSGLLYGCGLNSSGQVGCHPSHALYSTIELRERIAGATRQQYPLNKCCVLVPRPIRMEAEEARTNLSSSSASSSQATVGALSPHFNRSPLPLTSVDNSLQLSRFEMSAQIPYVSRSMRIASIAAGDCHSAAISRAGQLLVWGDADLEGKGQLKQNNVFNSSLDEDLTSCWNPPVEINASSFTAGDAKPYQIACSGRLTMILFE